jgi:hypothetical protein
MRSNNRPVRPFVWMLFIFIFSLSAFAQTSAFTYQGKLTDGVTAANGTYEMQFKLFDAASAGTQIGSVITNNSVAVASGVFTVNLDFGSSPFTGANRWLEIGVRKAPDPPGFTTLTPRQQITSSPYSIRTLSAVSADSLSNACVGCVDDAKITSVSGGKVTGTVANATTATNNVLKSGDTMTGALTLPANGLNVGTNQIFTSGNNVGIGTSTVTEKLQVNGNISIPATNNYLYNAPKTYRLTIGAPTFVSVNPSVYQGRIDDGFSSANVNGLNSLWATGGTPGSVAYFVAPVQLPDAATITAFRAQLIKNGGSFQSVVELFRTDSTGYLANTAQLIATATTTSSGGGVAYVNASSVNAAYNVVDNTNYHYFIRYSGEQNTQNLRILLAQITYQVLKTN